MRNKPIHQNASEEILRNDDELLVKPLGTIELPSSIGVLPLRSGVLFPGMLIPVLVSQSHSKKLITAALERELPIAITAIRDPAADELSSDSVHQVGVSARIIKAIQLPNGTINAILQGLERVALSGWTRPRPYMRARCRRLSCVEPTPDDQIEARLLTARRLLGQLVQASGNLPPETESLAAAASTAGQLADIAAGHLQLPTAAKQIVLEIVDAGKRLDHVINLLKQQLNIQELARKIESEVQGEIDRGQREMYLRERLRAIRRELGEDDDETAEIENLGTKIDEAGMPEEVMEIARQELDRLKRMPPVAAEYNVLRTYLDWLLDMPWTSNTEDNLDIAKAAAILDEDHYDLERVKKRILEYLAVRRLKPDMKGPILCFIGPPGVGKTSLGRSIARALGRRFVRLSLGGIHDEAEIRGHRRTYVGALPGRIIQSIKRAASMNPVFLLDEIDKVGKDFRGDPSAALLEVLDPEQNTAFSDHYLEVDFDLSHVLFLATANASWEIPDVLRDRMEILEIPGYTAEEKIAIAQQYLVPRQRDEHGLVEAQLTFDDRAILSIVRDYTEEAGVRGLERQVAAICRAVARQVAESLDNTPNDRIPTSDEAHSDAVATGSRDSDHGRPAAIAISPIKVHPADLHGFLGPVKFFTEVAERTADPGVSVGLAWTAAGGDILFVEATRMAGKGALRLTGQLGEVMKESGHAALSYLRSRATLLGIDESSFAGYDVHIHVPAGAVPKDGPSAGITMLVALASLFTNRPVHSDLGMTGEITLRGMVLPVGGIKNKVLAARRAGIQRVMLPAKNEKDLEEIPANVLTGLDFVFVQRIDEALEIALTKDGSPGPRKSKRRKAARSASQRRKEPSPQPQPAVDVS